MRILHTGDWHLGKSIEGYSRMDEQEQFLEDFVRLVEEEEIDLVIIAGDIYDSSNPPSRAETLFYKTLKRISHNGKRMSLVISGNHDNPERLVAATPLANEHGIIMVATPKSIISTGAYGHHTVVASGEGYIEIDINGERAVILTVPYPSEKRLNEVLYHEVDDEQSQLKNYNERMRMLFDNLSRYYRDDTINLVVSHLFTMGAEETGSERSIQLGGEFIIDSSCFPQKAQYVALGHIHKPFCVPNTGGKVRYAGSPLHYSKKEIHYQKGCYILEVKPQEKFTIKEVPFKTYKPIEVWKCKSIEEAILKCENNAHRECWVYLEIETDHYITEEEIKKMKTLKKDILEILPKIDTIQDEEVMLFNLLDKPFEEIFNQFYSKMRGVAPQTELVNLLLSILEEEASENEAY